MLYEAITVTLYCGVYYIYDKIAQRMRTRMGLYRRKISMFYCNSVNINLNYTNKMNIITTEKTVKNQEESEVAYFTRVHQNTFI